jgi:hypothetical protein
VAQTKGKNVRLHDSLLRYFQHREDLYENFEIDLLQLVRIVGPLVIVGKNAIQLYPYATMKEKTFLGNLFSAYAERHHEGEPYFNVTQQLSSPDQVGVRCEWILYSDGELENVSYVYYRDASRKEQMRRLSDSTNIRKHLGRSMGTVSNGYVNLRRFAVENGVDESLISQIEESVLNEDELEWLEELLQSSDGQHVYLLPNQYWFQLGIHKY